MDDPALHPHDGQRGYVTQKNGFGSIYYCRSFILSLKAQIKEVSHFVCETSFFVTDCRGREVEK